MTAGRTRIVPFVAAFIFLLSSAWTSPAQEAPRHRIGVAFGGGSARGFAHVGVIRWFEEHHVPIDVVSGTSMGGLVGGSFASGMSSEELRALLAQTDWNEMFGSSPFRYKNVRRKLDARAYPSRLEFGLKHGLGLPQALNNGQQVDLLLARIAAAYGTLRSFDDLPTPFRCVAVDLKTASPVVLDRGSLALALRSTMSLPGVFPPVEIDNWVLVDGGAMNNVPADIARAMGADVVVAVNVGSMSETRRVSSSLFGLVSNTMDAMMLASTRRGMAGADVVINPNLDTFGSLDWRRANELADEGYRAADAMKDKLLPYAVDEATWTQYIAARESRRRTSLPSMTSIAVAGAEKHDEKMIRAAFTPMLNQPADVTKIEKQLTALGGLDRYETLRWELTEDGTGHALTIRARPKPYGPPFLMISTALQNITNEDFSFQLAARYLAFDVAGSGSELRIDGAVGSDPSIGAELYRPIGATPLFVAGTAAWLRQRTNIVGNQAILAQYDQTRAFVLGDVGVNLGRDSEIRAGIRTGDLDASLKVGPPILPSLSGAETLARVRWIYDTQDNPIVPSQGTHLIGTFRHVFNAPDLPASFDVGQTNDGLTQAEIGGSVFWPARKRLDRLFIGVGAGTSFDGHPLISDQFSLGLPLRLDAFDIGEKTGNHYMSVTAGYLRGVGRLPDFLGGPIFLGGWLENGSAFDKISTAQWSTQVGLGAVLDTLLGPVLVGASFGFNGEHRYNVAIGRLF
jgi:NTE family protein